MKLINSIIFEGQIIEDITMFKGIGCENSCTFMLSSYEQSSRGCCIEVEARGKLAETICDKFNKGYKVGVVGYLAGKTNNPQSKVKIIAEHIEGRK